jgi:hypothetical protein
MAVMKIAETIVLLASLAGCSELDPYATFPRAARPGEDTSLTRVAICYDTFVSSLDQVQAAAQQECAADTVATYSSTEWYLLYCPLLLPARATYMCTPKK